MIGPATAALLTTGLLWLGDLVNRRWLGWLPDDPPRPGRKQHARPMPLAGVLLCPVLVGFLGTDPDGAAGWTGAAAVAVAAAVGFLDDRGKERAQDLDWRAKTLGLLLASALAATAFADPIGAPLAWCGAAGLAFVLANAVNFLDNTDGVAAGLCATGLLAADSQACWPVAAGFAALAFVPWNWPRPRLFLGDAGAYALGIALALAIAEGWQADGRALALAAVPLLDFAQVVAVRLWLRHPPWVGDRRHLTHVAQNLGVPRVATAPLFALLALLAIAAARR
jgi:UDP-N-acetylmuramyl pentapeptide phosphotransferase/UDP-N-acetylglucosamine-1-phosphate transferase